MYLLFFKSCQTNKILQKATEVQTSREILRISDREEYKLQLSAPILNSTASQQVAHKLAFLYSTANYFNY